MFNKKRLIALLTGTLLVGSLVSGCGSAGANSTSGSRLKQNHSIRLNFSRTNNGNISRRLSKRK